MKTVVGRPAAASGHRAAAPDEQGYMHDFGKIVYLELQKTGSSFVCQFMKAACVHPELRHQKHMHIDAEYRPDAVYFITVRRPPMLYSSLYRFGLDKRGGLYASLAKAGRLSVYQSFESFADYLLDPANGPFLHPFYSREIASEIGFVSFRYLLLNLQFPISKIQLCAQQKMPVSPLMEQSIISHVLKNESLNSDLLRLSTELLPEHFDAEKARAFLDQAPRANQSTTAADVLPLESPDIIRAIEARETLVMAHYA